MSGSRGLRSGTGSAEDAGLRTEPAKIQGPGEGYLKQVSQTRFCAKGKFKHRKEPRSLKGPKEVGREEMQAADEVI